MNKKMKKEKILYFFLYILISIPFFLSAAVSHYPAGIRFKRFGLEQGLMARRIAAICQDRQGFIWFGTNQGIVKHDGIDFSHFKHDQLNENTLCSDNVNCLVLDSQDHIWVGTDNGLDNFDPGLEQFLHFRHEPGQANTISDNTTWCVHQGATATWIGTANGLNKYHAETGTFTRYYRDPQSNRNIVLDIHEDSSGILWLATEVGIYKFDPGTGLFTPFSTITKTVWCIHEDQQGFYWFGGRFGLFRFDPSTGNVKHFLHDPQNPASIGGHAVHSILEVQKRNSSGTKKENPPKTELWFGTDNGISHFNTETQEFTNFHHNPLKLDSLSSNLVLSIFEDHSGVLWIGTHDQGLNKVETGSSIFAHYYHEPLNTNSLSNNLISSIYEDPQENLWIGTYEGGFNRFDSQTGKFLHYFNTPRQTANGSRSVTSITGDKQGKLWIGTFGGLYHFDPTTKRSQRYSSDSRNPHSLSHNTILCIYCDSRGFTWVGTYGKGLNCFDPNTKTFTRFNHVPGNLQALSGDMVTHICADPEGRLWIGTEKGLDHLDPATGNWQHYLTARNNPGKNFYHINSTHVGSTGSIWVATDRGLCLLDIETKEHRFFTVDEGFPSNKILGILEDNNGNLWISTDAGLAKFDPVSGGSVTRIYDYRDGLQHNEFGPLAFAKCRNGLMCFGGINGFNIFNPADVKDNLQPPPVVITAFRKLDREVKFDRPIWEIESLHLSYQAQSFSFEFAALDYHAPEKNRYAYIMEGFDPDWKYRDYRERAAYYTRLPQGKYTFRVKASNNSGVWNETGTAIEIVILPPFWRAWWFTLLSIALFALLSYIIISITRKYITLITFWKKKNFIGHYRIVEEIGSGGMGTVYKAEHIMDNNRTAAVKVIREDLTKDQVHRKRFLIEASIIDQLDHPHIVKIIERGEYNERLFIAMEYLNGESLAKRLERIGKFSLLDAVHIMEQLLDVIVKLHNKGIVHRDLKPENIMLVKNGNDENYVKLLDFGLAKPTGITQLTESGMLLGTISYLAPEIAAGEKFSAAADVYALGVIFYEMVTGEKPFIGESTLEIIKQILNETPIQPRRLRPEVPGKMNRLIMYMMTKIPRARPTATQVKDALPPLGQYC